MIKPTIGRVVWFTPAKGVQEEGFANHGDQVMAAIIAYVLNDGCVNLTVFDHCGHSVQKTSVRLLQEGEEKPEIGYYCEWMPYQIGQAKKESGK